MISLIYIGLFLAAIIVMVVLGIDWGEMKQDRFKVRRSGMLSGIGLFLFAIVIALSVGQVDAGHRGVVLNFGRVTDKTFSEGIYFKVPIVQTVVQMSVQTVAYETPAAAASKDLQDVRTEVTLNYSLNPNNVNSIYQRLRQDYESRIIRPGVQEAVKAATAKFDAEELITRRQEVKIAIEDLIRLRLEDNGLIVDTLNLTNFQFSPSFSASIEAKVTAVQKALEAENKLRQIEVEALQVEAAAVGQANANIASAEGEKKAAITRSEGIAEAIRIVAVQQAEANNLIRETLNQELIRYTLVRELAPDINTIVLPTGTEFILGESVLGGTP